LADQIADPFPAVLGVVAAEEGAADAPGDDVVSAGALVVDQKMTGEGHSRHIRSARTYIKSVFYR